MKKLLVPLFALLVPQLLGACSTAPAPVASSSHAPAEIRHLLVLGGNHAGSLTTRVEPDGTLVQRFTYNDRGRGPDITTRFTLDARGVPVRMVATGHDYWKAPVDERFAIENGVATWKNATEEETRPLDGPAFYVGLDALSLDLLARALLDAPGGRMALLPSGEATITRVAATHVRAGGAEHEVALHAIEGLGYSPLYLWLDRERRLFAMLDGWGGALREGAEDARDALQKLQDDAAALRQKALARALARTPAGALVVQGARLFDAETRTTRPDTTVLVSGDRIQAVGRDGTIPIPPGAEVIDAGGKSLLPGLWDMHAHLDDVDGILNLAAGVTTARDLANDMDQLRDRKRRWDTGEAIGPRVIMAGFMDGPGPYAGPTKVLVDTEEQALAAVDRYAELGYVQIKVYSSLDPALMPAILRRAHERGMRVSGHIPQGLTAEQAVRMGFDEIQHANFLFLSFLEGVDTRTPARFTAVAENAAALDLSSERVRAFVQLLAERGTVVDPTVTIFEDMFTGRPDLPSPSMAPVASRLPPQVRRQLRGMLPIPEGQDARYRDAYRAMLALVRILHEAGIPIVAGTDAPAGFALHRELESYVAAGIPAPDVLYIATLGAARVMKRDQELGSVAPGKHADFILVDGDPAARIGDIRRVVLTVKDGVVHDPAALYRAVGVEPVE